MPLFVKKLDPSAKLPSVAHPGEDLGYDVYALADMTIPGSEVYDGMAMVRTGIAACFMRLENDLSAIPYGLLIRDRSSVASKGVFVTAGVVDAGYRGEIRVVMTNMTSAPFVIKAGDKIAQLIPLPVMTGDFILDVQELPVSSRGAGGFGSSGR